MSKISSLDCKQFVSDQELTSNWELAFGKNKKVVKKDFNIGDIVRILYDNNKYEIVGFIEDELCILLKDNKFFGNVEKSKLEHW